MPRRGNKNDPLAGWRKENLAAPKRPQGQARNAPMTIYDDDPRPPPPQRPRTPPRAYPTRGPPPQQPLRNVLPRQTSRSGQFRDSESEEDSRPGGIRDYLSRGHPPRGRKMSRSPAPSPSPRSRYQSRSRSRATPPRRRSFSRSPSLKPRSFSRGLSPRSRSNSRGTYPKYRSNSRSTPPKQRSRSRGTTPRSRSPSYSPPDRGRSSSRGPPPSRGWRPPSRMPTRGPPPRPRSLTLSRSRSRGYSRARSRSRSRYGSPPPARNGAKKRVNILTEEEVSKCPHGDTRWPPPGEYTRPMHLLYKKNGIMEHTYYHLIHQNTAFEARDWFKTLDARASEATSKVPIEEAPQITIMNAFHSKKLRVISDGRRGKIWLLDEGSEEVWARMQAMQEERGAVRPLMGWETFEMFGMGLKGNNGDMLLISWPFPVEKVRPPK